MPQAVDSAGRHSSATPVEYCDALVVGSGFGGSVSAYRLAQAGRSTIVLERGQAYPPGGFARNPYEMSRAFWEPKDKLFGLSDVRSFRKLEAIVSSGLGGGSLIYANVLLRKDERWFVHDSPLPGGWVRALADQQGRPRAALRRGGGDDDAQSLALPGPAEGEGSAGGGAGARTGHLPSAAGDFVRPTGRTAGTQAGHPRTRLRQPPRTHPADLPPVRGVWHRLQRGRQEHPRPQLPLRREAPRRGPSHPLRGHRDHPTARWRFRGVLHAVRD